MQAKYPNYYVDCDFNSAKVGENNDVAGKPVQNTDGTWTNRFPDIIVHKRNFLQDNDYFCFEIKKWNNYDKKGAEKDRNNLEQFTSEYGYKFGFYLIFGKEKESSKWEVYKNGRKLFDRVWSVPTS